MRQKAIVAAAVAGAFAWPLAVSANSWDTGSATRDDATAAQTHHRSFMRHSEPASRSDLGAWEVATPYSPNETGVASPPRPSSTRADRAATAEYEPGTSFDAAQAEIMTPFSPNETGPVDMAQERHAPRTIATVRSLPNPQTPPSPNEVDASRAVDDMIAHREQVAGIEEAYAAVASAAGSTAGSYDERSLVRSEPSPSNEPAGVMEEQQPAARSDVTANDSAAIASVEPATPGRNEVDVTPDQPASVQSRDSLGLAPRDEAGAEPPEAAGAQTTPMAPESGAVTTPATPPSQSAAEASDNGGQQPVRSTM